MLGDRTIIATEPSLAPLAAPLRPRPAVVQTGALFHGGSGTTHLAMKSGVPQLLMPHLLDQYFWGYQVRRAGIGLELRERFSLDARAIAAALRRCQGDGALRDAAKRQAAATRLDGLARAVALVEGSQIAPIAGPRPVAIRDPPRGRAARCGTVARSLQGPAPEVSR